VVLLLPVLVQVVQKLMLMLVLSWCAALFLQHVQMCWCVSHLEPLAVALPELQLLSRMRYYFPRALCARVACLSDTPRVLHPHPLLLWTC
jgi:hypothetical protein